MLCNIGFIRALFCLISVDYDQDLWKSFERYIEPVLDEKYTGVEFSVQDLTEDVEGLHFGDVGIVLSNVCERCSGLESLDDSEMYYYEKGGSSNPPIERQEFYSSLVDEVRSEDGLSSVSVESMLCEYVADNWGLRGSMELVSKAGDLREELLENYNIEDVDGEYIVSDKNND